MLTGRVPFDNPDPMMQMRLQVKAPAPRLPSGKPDFSGTLDPATKALLTGADSDLAVYASTDGGDEWQEITYLSLAGSTAAIRSLERQCPRVVR